MNINYSCQSLPAGFSTIKGKNTIKANNAGEIYWYLANETPDLNRQIVIENIQKAFNIWGEVLDPIVFVQCSKKEEAEIVITFSHNDLLNTKDPFKPPFPFNDGVLGYAFPPADHSYSSDLFINDEFQWDTTHSEDVKDLLTVLIHEIGHTLNIGHSKDRKAIMYPTYAGVMTKLGEDDKLAIEYLYGSQIKLFKVNNRLGDKKELRNSLSNATLSQYSMMSSEEMMLELQTRDEIIDKLREFGNDLRRSLPVLDVLIPIILKGKMAVFFSMGKIMEGLKELKRIFSEYQGEYQSNS